MQNGNIVMIIPNENHLECVKKHYGKKHVIKNVITNAEGLNLYKIKGIRDYALKEDLQVLS